MFIEIRRIAPQDNSALAALIVSVVREFGCVGSEYDGDTDELDELSATFSQEGAEYWVVLDGHDGTLVGGGGYARLKGTSLAEAICELQKLYLAPSVRGKGVGKRLVDQILLKASEAGYREIYLECVPELDLAIKLYARVGFNILPERQGETGHASCSIFMGRSLAVHQR